MRDEIRQLILGLARAQGSIQNREIAERLGISRQAAHKHLRALVAEGELTREGRGRAARYLPGARRWSYELETPGLAEDRVWTRLAEEVPPLAQLPPPAAEGLHYALTELVNNVIDHAASPTVCITIEEREGTLRLDVEDRGRGVFAHVRRELGLASELEALQELSKGKTTTWPERHTGEGLFFTSKLADRFRLESGALAWVVDNVRRDMSAEAVEPPREGTRARFEAEPRAMRDLTELFAEYTEDFEFSRTRFVVKLFEIGERFVSRSEAKRLLHGLERFREIVLDFRGVKGVGQGFADEVFRVWQASHPKIRLEPVGMNEPVRFMIERARRAAARP